MNQRRWKVYGDLADRVERGDRPLSLVEQQWLVDYAAELALEIILLGGCASWHYKLETKKAAEHE